MDEWRRFFDEFAPRYDDEVFTRNTESEIAFLVQHLDPPSGGRILDVGCGTGRHGVGLAALGFRVTGVDLSSGMLEVARRRARSAGVEVEWVPSDAARFVREQSFDAAICLCEGAMCLLGPADDPLERDMMILRNVFRSMRPGARFILNVLNGYRQVRAFGDEDVAAGRFDPIDLTETSDVTGLSEQDLHGMKERGYSPPEIRRMLEWTGFRVLGVHGGTAGEWALRPPRLDEMELMLLCEKPGSC